MDGIAVSVIIPAYNIENYIGRCLESALAQTYTNLEIIVVDDGSSDGTGDIIDGYARNDLRIKVIHKKNGGVSSARLDGIRSAKGDYIGFVDGDDIIEPDMYERLVANAVKYGADISHCGYRMVFPDRIDYYYNTGRFLKQDKQKGLMDLLSGEFIEPGLWNKIYRRDILVSFAETGHMDSSIKINEDLLMNYYLFKMADLSVYEDFCPYHYILRKGSASSLKKSVAHVTDPVRVRKIIYDDISEKGKLSVTAYGIYIRALTQAARQNIFADEAFKARNILKQEIKGSFGKEGISQKLKFMAVCAAYFPVLFKSLNAVHEKVTGKDKKYVIE